MSVIEIFRQAFFGHSTKSQAFVDLLSHHATIRRPHDWPNARIIEKRGGGMGVVYNSEDVNLHGGGEKLS